MDFQHDFRKISDKFQINYFPVIVVSATFALMINDCYVRNLFLFLLFTCLVSCHQAIEALGGQIIELFGSLWHGNRLYF